MGAAPHVLHHIGPLAGAAILAGTTGRLVFGVLAFLLTIPLLRRLRTRTGSWVAPAAALTAMTALFALSSFVIGPLLADETSAPAAAQPSEALPEGASTSPGSDHDTHHAP